MLFKGFGGKPRGDNDDTVVFAAERFRLGQLADPDAEEPARPYNWEESLDYASEYPLGQTAMLQLVEPLPDQDPPPAAV
jgi:hypothetical protein